jgi:hypothetical protein
MPDLAGNNSILGDCPLGVNARDGFRAPGRPLGELPWRGETAEEDIPRFGMVADSHASLFSEEAVTPT